MAQIRWETAQELAAIQNEMNRLFNTLFEEGDTRTHARRWIPAIDLVETDEDFLLRVDLPGLSASDVVLELKDNVLTISGERRPDEQEREGYHRLERASGSFARSLTLPEGIDPERVLATFDRGVLEIRIPKPEQIKSSKVEISIADAQDADGSSGSEEERAQVEDWLDETRTLVSGGELRSDDELLAVASLRRTFPTVSPDRLRAGAKVLLQAMSDPSAEINPAMLDSAALRIADIFVAET